MPPLVVLVNEIIHMSAAIADCTSIPLDVRNVIVRLRLWWQLRHIGHLEHVYTYPTTPGIAPGGRAPNVVIDHHPSHPPAYPKAIAVIATVAALYFGREIFIPLAVALLLTFALSPLVAALR